MPEQRSSSVHAPLQHLHIVVLEDDVRLRQPALSPALRKHGFAVQAVASEAQLYRHMLARTFDIVVLGTGSDHERGLRMTQQLRAMSDVGIVVLTDDPDREQHTYTLRAGADVCLINPVDERVLSATLQSLARRLTPQASRGRIKDDAAIAYGWRLEAGGWQLVSPHGNAVMLTSAEQCVVTLLAQEKGRPVTRESLIRALSHRTEEFDPHRLDMLVHRLRRKAIDKTGERLPLLTARGVGYLLSCDMDACRLA